MYTFHSSQFWRAPRKIERRILRPQIKKFKFSKVTVWKSLLSDYSFRVRKPREDAFKQISAVSRVQTEYSAVGCNRLVSVFFKLRTGNRNVNHNANAGTAIGILQQTALASSLFNINRMATEIHVLQPGLIFSRGHCSGSSPESAVFWQFSLSKARKRPLQELPETKSEPELETNHDP